MIWQWFGHRLRSDGLGWKSPEKVAMTKGGESRHPKWLRLKNLIICESLWFGTRCLVIWKSPSNRGRPQGHETLILRRPTTLLYSKGIFKGLLKLFKALQKDFYRPPAFSSLLQAFRASQDPWSLYALQGRTCSWLNLWRGHFRRFWKAFQAVWKP